MVQIRVWIGEVLCVGRVVGLDAELCLDLLCKREVLKESKIHVGAAWSAQDVAPGSARCIEYSTGRSRNCERRGRHIVKKIAGLHDRLSNQIRTRRTRVAIYRYAELRAGLQKLVPVQLPLTVRS